jgi:effector-binding domain-containing protein
MTDTRTDTQPSEPRIVEADPGPTVAIRVTQPMSELDISALFDIHLPNIADRIAAQGGNPAGPPFARYHEFGPEQADIEIGIPVAGPVPNIRPLEECEPGEVGASQLPGGELAVLVHLGLYDRLGEAYDRLRDWIHAEGRHEGRGPWESYVDDPTEVDDPVQLRTEVIWPLG